MALVTRSKSIAGQVEEILRERISRAVYTSGVRLPSESEFAGEFGVSRATIRTVLAKLSAEGLILRRQGDGTYVNDRIQEANAHLGGLWDFAHLIEGNGFEVSIQPILIEVVTATEDNARTLGIKVGDELLLMERLFFANGEPAILARNLIPVSLLAVSDQEIDGSLRIREIMKRYFHQEIAFVITEISPSFSGENSSILDVESRDCLLNLKMTFYSIDNQLLTIGDNYLNDDVLKPRLVQAWN